jgi:hypothetical protein
MENTAQPLPQAVEDKPATRAAVLIDNITGAYLFGDESRTRLYVLGRHYGSDDALPREAFLGLNSAGDARSFVAGHLVRRFGADSRHWPLQARRFLER